MAKKPNIPCAGGCGKLLWSGGTTAVHSEPTCRPCRALAAVGSRTIRRPCRGCGVEFDAEYTGGPTSGYRVSCSAACRTKVLKVQGPVKACVDCGGDCRSYMPQPRCKACSASRLREQNRRKCHARRAVPGECEPYTLAEIAKRDKNICQLCRRRVAMTKSVPHPKAPTIDHVVPLSEGGLNVRANVQLAHFRCNSVKGARGTQQLALIG